MIMITYLVNVCHVSQEASGDRRRLGQHYVLIGKMTQDAPSDSRLEDRVWNPDGILEISSCSPKEMSSLRGKNSS